MSVYKSSIDQLEAVIQEYDLRENEFLYENGLENSALVMETIARMRAVVQRLAPINSIYFKQCEEIIATQTIITRKAKMLYGTVKSLRSDYIAGYLQRITDLIHGDLFADFLDMSKHLTDEGYKDAAAVIAGTALEAHLRQLCIKAGIETEVERNDKIQPKNADRMNSDLAKEEVYSKLDQKNVTAWLDLRNKAAHGQYAEYTKEQVSNLISGIRDFLTRNPA